MKPHSTALQDRSHSCAGRVLGVSCPETVEVKCVLDFPQTVVEAIPKLRPKPPAHDLAIGPTYLVSPALKEHTEVCLSRKADAPRFVRRLDIQSVARTVTEARHCLRRRCRLFLYLDLLLF